MALNLTKFQNKNIHIVGVSGMEGLAVWRFLKKHKIAVTLHDFSENLQALKESLFSYHDYLSQTKKEKIWADLSQEKINLKENYLRDINEADIVFVGQAWFRYPANDPIKFLPKTVNLKQLTELYFENFPGTIIGVTGSNGKSTTANLIFHLLKDLKGRRVWLSGNDRQNPPVILEIEKATKNDLLILEISNRQLIDFPYSPQIAVVTTLEPTHLDDHKTFDNYLRAKENIVRHQKAKDLAVLNYDNENVRDFANVTRAKVEWFGLNTAVALQGAFLVDGDLTFIFNSNEKILSGRHFRLPGEHNLKNALAASLVAKFLGMSRKQISRRLISFRGLAYRLELVAKFKKTKFYNDSQATSPEAGKAAVESFPRQKKIVIAGGKAKLNPKDFDSWLLDLINNKVKILLLIGEAGIQIKQRLALLKKRIPFVVKECQNMETAVAEAFANLNNIDLVLMSPACESFGEFTDYRERGQRFTQLVKENIKKFSK
jgi:UDP-N-acetylmuramoylalanine--D-glutamate ligase